MSSKKNESILKIGNENSDNGSVNSEFTSVIVSSDDGRSSYDGAPQKLKNDSNIIIIDNDVDSDNGSVRSELTEGTDFYEVKNFLGNQGSEIGISTTKPNQPEQLTLVKITNAYVSKLYSNTSLNFDIIDEFLDELLKYEQNINLELINIPLENLSKRLGEYSKTQSDYNRVNGCMRKISILKLKQQLASLEDIKPEQLTREDLDNYRKFCDIFGQAKFNLNEVDEEEIYKSCVKQLSRIFLLSQVESIDLLYSSVASNNPFNDYFLRLYNNYIFIQLKHYSTISKFQNYKEELKGFFETSLLSLQIHFLNYMNENKNVLQIKPNPLIEYFDKFSSMLTIPNHIDISGLIRPLENVINNLNEYTRTNAPNLENGNADSINSIIQTLKKFKDVCSERLLKVENPTKTEHLINLKAILKKIHDSGTLSSGDAINYTAACFADIEQNQEYEILIYEIWLKKEKFKDSDSGNVQAGFLFRVLNKSTMQDFIDNKHAFHRLPIYTALDHDKTMGTVNDSNVTKKLMQVRLESLECCTEILKNHSEYNQIKLFAIQDLANGFKLKDGEVLSDDFMNPMNQFLSELNSHLLILSPESEDNTAVEAVKRQFEELKGRIQQTSNSNILNRNLGDKTNLNTNRSNLLSDDLQSISQYSPPRNNSFGNTPLNVDSGNSEENFKFSGAGSTLNPFSVKGKYRSNFLSETISENSQEGLPLSVNHYTRNLTRVNALPMTFQVDEPSPPTTIYALTEKPDDVSHLSKNDAESPVKGVKLEQLYSNEGLTVYAPMSGKDYNLRFEDREEDNVVHRATLALTEKNTDFKARALTIINMIENIVSQGKRINIKTNNLEAALIAHVYVMKIKNADLDQLTYRNKLIGINNDSAWVGEDYSKKLTEVSDKLEPLLQNYQIEDTPWYEAAKALCQEPGDEHVSRLSLS